MSTMSPFPGHAFTSDLEPLSPAAPPFTEAMLNDFACKALVAIADSDVATAEAPDASLVWVLDEGTDYTMVPFDHVVMAIEQMGLGRAVLLLSDDADAERYVREGLFDLYEQLDRRGQRVGRA